MARRLALLALLACVAIARRPPDPSSDASDSESMDPLVLFDDYESFEPTPPPRQRTKSSNKVLLRGKGTKVNVTMKNPKSENKKNYQKSTTINIESHTNFIMTKRPPVMKPMMTKAPQQENEEEYGWMDESNMVQVSRPGVQHRATTRRPTTRRRPSTTTRRATTTRTPKRTPKPTKKLQTKNTTCRPNRSGLLSNYFQDNKFKQTSKKPAKPVWIIGLFSKVYNWISKSSWFGGGGWFQEKPNKPRTTTTTIAPEPVSIASSNWFQTLLDTEENDDGAYVIINDNKKPAKKSIKKNYKGYQLLRAYPDAQWKVREMLDLQDEGQGSGLMWWTAPSLNGTTDLLVPPDLLVDVKDHLKSSKTDFDVIIWDLQKAITYENPRLSKKQRLELEQLRGHPMTWRRYHRYTDILRYLEYLQHSHADLVELVPLGRSSEGLPLVAVKISLPSNETHTREVSGSAKKKWKLRSRMKPAVWLDGGTHAREWIAPAVTTWMLHTLVEGEKGLGAELEMLKQADFYILPVLNPDGYEHSHTHDRLWMKTRSRFSDHSDDYYVGWFPWNWGRTECVGVDADRNWDYHWGEQDSSRDPCADNYMGPHPFSEPETRAVSEFLAENRGQIKVYISLHAYSQSWLMPSSHAHAPFSDEAVVMEMGKLATVALSDLYGTKYKPGLLCLDTNKCGCTTDWLCCSWVRTIYKALSHSQDYAAQTMGVCAAAGFVFTLPGTDKHVETDLPWMLKKREMCVRFVACGSIVSASLPTPGGRRHYEPMYLCLLYNVPFQVAKVGTAAEISQPASGMSHDWAKARAGIKFAYHVDLRDSYGPYGFLLPGSQIVSTARETWQAVKAIVDNLHPE